MDIGIDDILTAAHEAQAVFAAGVKAADATSPAAHKLRRLIERAAQAEALFRKGWAIEGLAQLSAAIKEARR